MIEIVMSISLDIEQKDLKLNSITISVVTAVGLLNAQFKTGKSVLYNNNTIQDNLYSWYGRGA